MSQFLNTGVEYWSRILELNIRTLSPNFKGVTPQNKRTTIRIYQNMSQLQALCLMSAQSRGNPASEVNPVAGKAGKGPENYLALETN